MLNLKDKLVRKKCIIMEKIIRLFGIVYESLVNGLGMRRVFFV